MERGPPAGCDRRTHHFLWGIRGLGDPGERNPGIMQARVLTIDWIGAVVGASAGWPRPPSEHTSENNVK